MTEQRTTNPFGRLMEELAASRGISLEELAERASATGRAAAKITAAGLRGERPDEPGYNYGAALDVVLNLTPEERRRIPEAFTAHFLSPAKRRSVVTYTEVRSYWRAGVSLLL